jgi:hypothetical protein
MEGAGGFHKDVAIKLMRDEDVPELSLQRFRDEARILGLVRDRAIVNVDPPTRLAGRWDGGPWSWSTSRAPRSSG